PHGRGSRRERDARAGSPPGPLGAPGAPSAAHATRARLTANTVSLDTKGLLRQAFRHGADGARTRDLLAASQTLSQLSYGPKLRSKSSVQSAKGLSPQGTVPAAALNRDRFRIVPRGIVPAR